MLCADADHAATAEWCERVRSLLLESPGAVVRCDVGGLSGPAAAVLDALARLRLTASGCGGRMVLRGADPALLALLELVGLADLLQPEDVEQGGVEVHVQAGDPPVPPLEDVDRRRHE